MSELLDVQVKDNGTLNVLNFFYEEVISSDINTGLLSKITSGKDNVNRVDLGPSEDVVEKDENNIRFMKANINEKPLKDLTIKTAVPTSLQLALINDFSTYFLVDVLSFVIQTNRCHFQR